MVKFVYTLSSINKMFEWAFLSINSVLKQTEPHNIIVFFTPPRRDSHIDYLETLGIDVRLVDNSTEAFSAFDKEQHYGEKTWITTVNDDRVVFLDCDTIVFGDINEVIKGDFDFKARPGTSDVQEPEWSNLFKRYNEEYVDWMPNAGFMIFKNGTHKNVGEKWRDYINTELNYQHYANHKEQYALALSIGEYNTSKMDKSEHSMLWNQEFLPDSTVYHIGDQISSSTSDGIQDKMRLILDYI